MNDQLKNIFFFIFVKQDVVRQQVTRFPSEGMRTTSPPPPPPSPSLDLSAALWHLNVLHLHVASSENVSSKDGFRSDESIFFRLMNGYNVNGPCKENNIIWELSVWSACVRVCVRDWGLGGRVEVDGSVMSVLSFHLDSWLFPDSSIESIAPFYVNPQMLLLAERLRKRMTKELLCLCLFHCV